MGMIGGRIRPEFRWGVTPVVSLITGFEHQLARKRVALIEPPKDRESVGCQSGPAIAGFGALVSQFHPACDGFVTV